MSSIAQRIRHYRKKRGLTQMTVAAALGVRTDNYAKYESGARVPRADRLVRLAKILNVSYDTLNEGVEREFADLLKSHAIGVITGEPGSFTMFVADMRSSEEAYGVISYFFDMALHRFIAGNPQLLVKYLNEPDLAGLIELYDIYSERNDALTVGHIDGIPLTLDWLLTPLETVTTVKLAFCIAVRRYLDQNDDVFILDEAEKLAGSILDTIDALQFFAVKVFVPYLSILIDTVELCMNTTIDDFEKAFLFYALTHPDDEGGCDYDDDDDI